MNKKNSGKLIYHKSLDTNIVHTVTAFYFQERKILNKDESNIILNLTLGLHNMIPLKLDISDSNLYLLDNIELRLCFDLNPASFFNLRIFQQDKNIEWKLPNFI